MFLAAMNILVAVDLSEASGAVLRDARDYARHSAAKVWLVHVVPADPEFIGYEPGPQVVRDAVAREFRQEHQQLEAEAARFEAEGVTAIPLLVQGPFAETILEEADKLDIDLIVLGSHGHGMLHQVFMGSVCESVLHKATRPVLVVPTRGQSRPEARMGSAGA